MTIDPQEFGEMKANIEVCKQGIEDIKTIFGDHLQNYREDIKDLHSKGDKSNQRIDIVKQEYAKDKGKAIGFLAVMSALWAIISVLCVNFVKWIMGHH